MMSLTQSQIRSLKSLAQRLDACLRVGKAGLTDSFIASVAQALNDHELIKIKFAAFQDQKKTLAATLAERTESELIWIVGHVAVYYRMNPNPARRRLVLDTKGSSPAVLTPDPSIGDD